MINTDVTGETHMFVIDVVQKMHSRLKILSKMWRKLVMLILFN